MAAALIVFLLGVGLAGTTWRLSRETQPTWWERAFRGVIPLMIACALIMLIERIAAAPMFEWNEAKLAPVVAMTYGYDLYQDPDAGVMTGWIYGPIAALLLLPGALGKTPTGVMLIGVTINFLAYFIPSIWLLSLICRGMARQWLLLLTLFLFWYTLSDEGLTRCTTIAGADGPGLGLAACAVAAIYRTRTNFNLILGAGFAVLCCWTKQSYLTLPVGMFAYVAIADGPKRAAMFAGFVTVAAIIISTPLVWYFGASRMYFHMIEMPGHHPLRENQTSYFLAWSAAALDLFRVSVRAIGILGISLAMSAFLAPEPAQGLRRWITSRPWLLLLFIALFLVPSSIIPYSKVGGFLNTLACTHYFLLLGACGALAATFQRASTVPPLARSIFAMLCVITLVTAANDMFSDASRLWPYLSRPRQAKQTLLYEYVRARPGTVYCPWQPLTTLLVDRKLYHFEWGVMDRVYAKRNPTNGQIANHVPATMSQVIYVENPPSLTAHNALGAYRRQVQQPELPGLLVFVN